METAKAKGRREREEFFGKYCQGDGIDIGCGDDPITSNCDRYDISFDPSADATYMKGIPNEIYDFVYSSHCLEDLARPDIAIKNWYRILKRGGYLIICVPHRDLFEKKKTLPSAGNANHHNYYLIDRSEPPITIGMINLIVENLRDYDIEYIKKCDEGYSYYLNKLDNGFTQVIANGEFSIEMVLKKGNDTEYI